MSAYAWLRLGQHLAAGVRTGQAVRRRAGEETAVSAGAPQGTVPWRAARAGANFDDAVSDPDTEDELGTDPLKAMRKLLQAKGILSLPPPHISYIATEGCP